VSSRALQSALRAPCGAKTWGKRPESPYQGDSGETAAWWPPYAGGGRDRNVGNITGTNSNLSWASFSTIL